MFNQILNTLNFGAINAEIAITNGLAHAAPYIKLVSAAVRTALMAHGIHAVEFLEPFLNTLNIPDGIFPEHLLDSLHHIAGDIIQSGDMDNILNGGDIPPTPEIPDHLCIDGTDIYVPLGASEESVVATVCDAQEGLACHENLDVRLDLLQTVRENDPEALGLPPTQEKYYPADTCIDAGPLLKVLDPNGKNINLMKEPMSAYEDQTLMKLPLSSEEVAKSFATSPIQEIPQSTCGSALIPFLGALSFGIGTFYKRTLRHN